MIMKYDSDMWHELRDNICVNIILLAHEIDYLNQFRAPFFSFVRIFSFPHIFMIILYDAIVHWFIANKAANKWRRLLILLSLLRYWSIDRKWM